MSSSKAVFFGSVRLGYSPSTRDSFSQKDTEIAQNVEDENFMEHHECQLPFPSQKNTFTTMATASKRKSSGKNMISLRRITAALASIIALLFVPVQSFGSFQTAADLGRSRTSPSTPLSLLASNSASRSFIDPTKERVSTICLLSSKDNKNNEGGEGSDEGLFAEKNIPGLVFTTILTLWHFWIGPALRPIILDMQQ